VSHLWRLITSTQACASPNHRQAMKPKPSRLIPRNLTVNLDLLIAQISMFEFCWPDTETHLELQYYSWLNIQQLTFKLPHCSCKHPKNYFK